jgi:hypothetical protein
MLCNVQKIAANKQNCACGLSITNRYMETSHSKMATVLSKSNFISVPPLSKYGPALAGP